MRTYVRKRTPHCLIENVQELCRLCLQRSDEKMNIFNDDSSALCPLALRIRMCVGLEISKEESLSNMICKDCFQQLEQIYEFRKKCELSYCKLKSHLTALKQNINNYPPKVMKLEFFEDNNEDEIEGKLEGNLKIDFEENSGDTNVNNLDGYVNTYNNEDCTLDHEEKQESLIPNPSTSPSDPPMPDHVMLSNFLKDLLVKVGLLVQQDDGTVTLADGACNIVHLEMPDQSQLTLQLGEENEEIDFVGTADEMLDTTVNNEEVILSEVDVLGKYNYLDNMSSDLDIQNLKIRKKPGVQCGQCGVRLSSRGVLARHARSHAAARPHACPRCPRAFTTRAALLRHLPVHHKIRPFACSQCPKSFTQRDNLEQHALTHCAASARPRRLFHCATCPKVFMHRSGLSRHAQTCSKPTRKFECAACSRHFSERGSLLRHLRHAHKHRHPITCEDTPTMTVDTHTDTAAACVDTDTHTAPALVDMQQL